MSTDVLTFGEAMVAVRSPGPLELGGNASLGVVGSESNVAIGLRRLGHSVRWVSRIGDDPMGRLVVRTLRAEDVDVASVSVVQGAPTGLIFFDTTAFGRRRAVHRRHGSAATHLGPADLKAPLEMGAKVLHVSGITPALSESCRSAVAETLSAAHAKGWITSLDVNHRPALWTDEEAAGALRPLLPWVRVLIASVSELPLMADGQREDDRIAALRDVPWVAVKRGALGASLYADGRQFHREAVPVVEVDPVGAGDAFTAGLISGLLDDLGPDASLDRACALGAAVAASSGDWEGLPTRLDLARVPARGDLLEVDR